jgi:transcriptional/translational regulatory protein YebC/TACO1
LATENGADDMDGDSDVVTITCPPEAFVALREALEAAGYTDFLTDEITKTAETSVSPSLEDSKKTMRLIDLLEDDDDIENVYSNFDPSEEVMAALT